MSVDGDGVYVVDVYFFRGGYLIWYIYCFFFYYELYMGIVVVDKKNNLFINFLYGLYVWLCFIFLDF